MMQRKILVILENKPGALARVVGLFHQRGYNIESLHVDPVKDVENYKEIEDSLDLKLQENEVDVKNNIIKLKTIIVILFFIELILHLLLN